LIWRRSLWWQVLLLAGSCLLLLGIIQVWVGNDLAPETSRGRKGPVVPQVKPLRDQHPLSDFTVVSARNLFSQTRTGPIPGAKAPKAQGNLEGCLLLGTIIIGDEKAALISDKPGKGRKASQVLVMRLGEEWEGFKVVEISNESIVFQGKEGKKILNFPE
jgi:hypothetical protein